MTTVVEEVTVIPEKPELEITWEDQTPVNPVNPVPPPRHAKEDSGQEGAASEKRIPRARAPRHAKAIDAKKDDKLPQAKVRAPDFTEWHEYIGDFVIKWVARGYIAYVFRGFDRHDLLPKEVNDALELDSEQRSDIAKPIAHLASRSSAATKYGRVIIDSTDGVVAMISLGMWASRVNRIANKYMNRDGGENGEGRPSGEDVPANTGIPGPAFVAPNGIATGHGFN